MNTSQINEPLKTLDFSVFRSFNRRRNRQIARMILAGATAAEAGKRFGIKQQAVCLTCRALKIDMVGVRKSIQSDKVSRVLKGAGENPTWLDVKRVTKEERLKEHTVRRILHENDVYIVPRPSPKSNKTLRIQNMILRGDTEAMVSEVEGMSLARVREFKKKHNLPLQEPTPID